MMIDWSTAFAWSTALPVAAVFLAAGFCKGVVGLGLPIFAVSLLTHIIGIREAIYITLIPAMLTSLAQAVAGPAFVTSLKRLWPILVVGGVAIMVSTQLGMKGDKRIIAFIVGTLIMIYALVSLLNVRFPPPGRNEKYLSPLFGLLGGAVGGMSGMYAMPVVPYLQTLGLKRDELIQSIAIWFLTGAGIMVSVVGINGAYTRPLVVLTVIASVTSLFGVWLGGMARGKMSEKVFVKTFLVAFFILGAGIFYRAF
jgi:uncharacterized membrane protein YfcA